MHHVQDRFKTGHAQYGENPELRVMFYRLAMLANRPLHAIFVADGPLRPKIKRGRQVKMTPPWLTEGTQRLVNAFGFGWIEVRTHYSSGLDPEKSLLFKLNLY